MTVEEFKLSELTSKRQKHEEAIDALEAQIERVLSSPGPTEDRHIRRVSELRYKLNGERAGLDSVNRQIQELVAEMESLRYI